MMEYVVSYVSMLLSFSSYLFFYKKITRKSLIINRTNIICMFVLVLISTLALFVSLTSIPIFINMMVTIIIIKLFFNVSIKESFFYTMCFMILGLFCDGIVSMFIGNSSIKNFKIFQHRIYIRAILIIPVFFMTYLFLFALKIQVLINKAYNGLFIKSKKNKKKMLFYFYLLLIFIDIIYGFNAYNNVDKKAHLFLLILILAFILLFIFVLHLLYKEYQYELVNKKIIDENNYIRQISNQDAEFKHNVINNLLGIKTVSNKKAKLLIDELINSYQTEYKTISSINDLPTGIQSIIYRKAYEENIENLNLIVDNAIKNELYDLLNPKEYNNLCTSIGILFDNALDAVRDMSKKIIYIEFEESKKNISVIIKNTFSNTIDLEEIGKKNYTTKINGHGIGLKYLYKLKTLNFTTKIIDNMFVSKIVIKK